MSELRPISGEISGGAFQPGERRPDKPTYQSINTGGAGHEDARVPRRPANFGPGATHRDELGGGETEAQRIRRDGMRSMFLDAQPPGSVDPGVVATQAGVVRDLVARLDASATNAPGIVSKIVEPEDFQGTPVHRKFWHQLDDLIRDTEYVTKQPVRYTPEALAASLAPYADAKVSEIDAIEAEKRAAPGFEDRVRLAPDQQAKLRDDADAVLMEPAYLTEHSAQHITPRAEFFAGRTPGESAVLSKQRERAQATKTILDQFVAGEATMDDVVGAMRSDPHCMIHSAELIDKLQAANPDLAFVRAFGQTNNVKRHDIVIALPSAETKQKLVDLQDARGYAGAQLLPRGEIYVISPRGMQEPDVPPLGDATVIDSTVLQMLNQNPFLEDIPYADRVTFARSLAPESFSADGIFVGSYRDYVRFLAQVGVEYAHFNPTTSTELIP